MPYHVKLSQFEGPLDLLLHLISNARIRIEDIFVSEITEQYIRHMEGVSELDMDRASEFLQMAATLLYIKSRMLVPRRKEEEEAGEIDPEQELIERLKAYQAYKKACGAMKTMEQDALDRFYRLPEEPAQVLAVSFEGITLEALCRAYRLALKRIGEPEEPERPLQMPRETFSIRDKMRVIERELKAKGKVSFLSLFETAGSRLEAAVIFLAVLELMQQNKVTIRQQSCFGDILIDDAKKVG